MRPRAVLRGVLLLSVVVVAAGQGLPAAQSKPIVAETYYNTFSRAHPVLARIKPGETVSTKTLDASGRDDTGMVRARAAESADRAVLCRRRRARRRARRAVHQGADEPQLGIQSYRLGPVFADAGVDRRALSESLQAGRDHQRARQRRAVGSRSRASDGAPARAVERRAQDGVSREADARLRRRGAGRRFRADLMPVRHPTAAISTTTRSARARRSCCRSIIRARCCSSATAMRCKATASRPAPASKRRWTSSSRSSVRKKVNLTGPRAETSEHIISIGSQPEFVSSTNRGLQMATSDMVNWLTSEYKMEPWAAHLLIGYQGRYDIVTVAGSVALKIPKKQLPQ